MVTGRSNLDVSLSSYDDWIQFFFDRPRLRDDQLFADVFCPDAASFDVSDPRRIVSNLERLFTDFRHIAERYTLRQINQALWAMLGSGFELPRSLWDPSVSRAERLACVRSMRRPFADVVAGHPAPVMETCFYMWWDLVLESFWSLRPQPPDYAGLDADGRVLLDVAFETLCSILALDDVRCQEYALHGLGHLHHPEAPARIEEFIVAHRVDLSADQVAWLEACRNGSVL